ncbi:MAG: HD domain-containing phosphohydrolase [Gemmatimonas sp.]
MTAMSAMTDDVPTTRAPACANVSVLFVDDDSQILRGIERSLGPRFHVVTARSGADAVRLLDDEQRFAVVVSDLHMPGMNGVTVLRTFRARAPDTVRVLFTGEAELADAVHAVNDAEVFRLLLKPATGSTLLAVVQAAIRQHELLQAERTLQEHTLHGAVEALTEVLAIAQPAAYGRALRLTRHVKDLSTHLGLDAKWEIEVAALLSQLGCISLSSDLVDRWYHHRELSESEQAQIANLPAAAEAMIAHIPRLERICAIIRRQYEPSTTRDVPVGARVLAIARDFDLLIGEGETAARALAMMGSRGAQYDRRFLEAFIELRGDQAPAAEIRVMRLCDVRPGMHFAEDVHSPKGLLLIARGQEVSEALRERISQQWSQDFTSTRDVRVVAS